MLRSVFFGADQRQAG